MKHGILTILAPIIQDREDQVRDRLLLLQDGGLPTAPLIGLHFASLSVIKDSKKTHYLRPHVLFDANFDGTREDFIDALVTHGGPWLDTVFQDCEGYPDAGTELAQVVKNYLLAHDAGADCVYIAYPFRTVGQIQHEHRLRNEVARLDAINRFGLPQDALAPPRQRSLVARIRTQIAEIPALQGALTLPERPFVTTYGPLLGDFALRLIAGLLVIGAIPFAIPNLENYAGNAGVAVTTVILMVVSILIGLTAVWRPGWQRWSVIPLIAAVLSVFTARNDNVQQFLAATDRGVSMIARLVVAPVVVGLVLAVIAWLILVQIHESWRDPDPPLPSWDPDEERSLRGRERHDAQNLLIGLNAIKPGFLNLRLRLWILGVFNLSFRLMTVRFVLWTIHFVKYLTKSGRLAGISSIHFARWVIVNHGRHVLFISHYDGDWDAYLGDFVEQAKKPLTAIWSNCVGFPRSWFLFFGGAGDQRAFKAYARRSQHRTLWVHRAYPDLAVSDIENHTAIREALGSSLDAAGLEALLRRL
jgi:hypothetical protein